MRPTPVHSQTEDLNGLKSLFWVQRGSVRLCKLQVGAAELDVLISTGLAEGKGLHFITLQSEERHLKCMY